MSNATQPRRYELKFVCSSSDLDWLRPRLAQGRVVFRAAYEPRTIRNIYFDSPNLDCYYQNLSGVSQRDKIRLRWYGDDRLPAAGVLEFKRKRGMLGWKDCHPIRDLPRSPQTRWRELSRHIADALSPAATLQFSGSDLPVLINAYSRRYLESTDGQVRMTIDTRLQAWNQIRTARPNLRCPAMFPDVAVIELKADAEHYEQLRLAIQDIPLRVSRFSKFCVGLQNFLQPGNSVIRAAGPH